MSKIAITSGFYLFCHPGHIECMKMARELADQLVVIVNNDRQLFEKKGVPSPQNENDRMAVVGAIRYVDRVVLATDRDGTVCETLENLIQEAAVDGHEVIWCKGGDRFSHNTPELKVCEKYGIKFVDGLGAKTHSSSEYIKRVRE